MDTMIPRPVGNQHAGSFVAYSRVIYSSTETIHSRVIWPIRAPWHARRF